MGTSHELKNFPNLFLLFNSSKLLSLPQMSFSSKVKKVKPKGTVRELKLVQSVSRRGTDVVKAEEVQMPREEASTSRCSLSSSPVKRRKLEALDFEPVPFDMEGPDLGKKRPTLVVLFCL